MEARHMMEAGVEDVRTPVKSDGRGIVQAAVGLSLDLTETTTEAVFGLVRDVHGEVSKRIGATIDWAEGTSQSLYKLTRDAHHRVEKLTRVSINAGESFAQRTLAIARDAGYAASDATSKLVVSVVGSHDGHAAN